MIAGCMRGRNLVIGFGAALFLVVGAVFWIGMSGGSTHVPPGKPGVAFTPSPRVGPGTGPGAGDPAPGASGASAASTPVLDKKARDELRRRILAGWAAGDDAEAAAAARAGRVPEKAPSGGPLDAKYIQEVVRSDFFPMAVKCYEELQIRKKDARGRIEIKFKIIGDEKLGGIIEEADIDNDGGLADEKLDTCLRESFLSLSFKPPPKGGWVTVVYPMEFSPDDPDQ
jgi:hypothetical protein